MSDQENYGDMDYGLAQHHNLFNSTDDVVGNDTESNVVPEPSLEAAKADAKGDTNITADPELIEMMLQAACDEMGCEMTDEMWNTVLSASSIYSIDDDSMRWFIHGMTYSHNQKIIPLLGGLIKDIRAEVKLMQSTNSNLKTTAGDITKKMVSVKDEVLSGFDKLRVEVIDKFTNQVSDEESVTSLKVKPLPKKEGKSPVISSGSITEVPKAEQKPKDTKGIDPAVIAGPSKLITPTHIEIPDYAEPEENVLDIARDKYLIEAGLDDEYFDESMDEVRNDLLGDEELIELMYGSDDKLKQDIMDKLISEVVMLSID
ncbi:TPA_asm: P [Triticum alphacytorhabdovirus 1]|nr:TPA_asm: P [Triticum alphacytorhabdovirus 1]